MKKICVGIIGVGRIGKIHLNNLSNHLKSIEIGAISDIDEKKEKLCKDYGINKFYKSYQDEIAMNPEGHAMDYIHIIMDIEKI